MPSMGRYSSDSSQASACSLLDPSLNVTPYGLAAATCEKVLARSRSSSHVPGEKSSRSIPCVGCVTQSVTMPSGSVNARGFRSTPSTALNTAVAAPMPSPMVSTIRAA